MAGTSKYIKITSGSSLCGTSVKHKGNYHTQVLHCVNFSKLNLITFVNILAVEEGSVCIVMLLLQPDCCMSSYTQFEVITTEVSVIV